MNYYETYEDNFINAIKVNIKKLIIGLHLNKDQGLINEIYRIFKESLKPPYKGGIYFKGRFKPEVIASTMLYFVLKNSDDYKSYFKPKNRYTNDKFKRISARSIAKIAGITQATINRRVKMFEDKYNEEQKKIRKLKINQLLCLSQFYIELLLKYFQITKTKRRLLRISIKEFFEDLRKEYPTVYIYINTMPKILAGATFFYFCKINFIRNITLLEISRGLNEYNLGIRKDISLLYKIIKRAQGHTIKDDVESNLKKILSLLKIPNYMKKSILLESKSILQLVFSSISETCIKNKANTNSMAIAGAISYYIFKSNTIIGDITFARIAKLISIKETSIKNYFYRHIYNIKRINNR